MPRPFCVLLVFFSLLLFTSPASCQATDFVSALSGDKHPLTLKLKDLDSSWRCFSSGTVGPDSDQLRSSTLELYVEALTGGNHYYSKGETITLGDEIYLIAYHQRKIVNFAAVMEDRSEMQKPPKLTPESELTLSLLKIRLLSGLSNIQPFSLATTLNPTAAPAESDPNQVSVDHLKQIGLALTQYTQDYDEALPPMKTAAQADDALYPYLKNRSLLEHPATHELYQVNTSLSHRNMASFQNLSTMVVYFEARPDADGLRAVLFLDGHVERIEEAKWRQLKAASHIPYSPASLPPPFPPGPSAAKAKGG